MRSSEAELEVVAEAIGPVLMAGETVRLELTTNQSFGDAQAFVDRLEKHLGIKLDRAQLIGTSGAALAVWKAGAESPLIEASSSPREEIETPEEVAGRLSALLVFI